MGEMGLRALQSPCANKAGIDQAPLDTSDVHVSFGPFFSLVILHKDQLINHLLRLWSE